MSRFALIASFFFAPISGLAQTVNVAGHVFDAREGYPLPGASVELLDIGEGTITRNDGSFALTDIPPGQYTLRARFVGYSRVDTLVTAPVTDLTIRLHPATVEIGEVVVTGSPIGSTVRYQAVHAFNREDLERRSASSLGEMLDGVPGLAMRSMGPAPARPVIRGFDGDRVVVLENGERPGDLSETAADHAVSLDPLAADRVEVVRGPASLLYGSGAIGGVVNVLTDDIPTKWDDGASGDLAVHSNTVNRQAAGFARLRYGAGRWVVGGRVAARGAGDMRTPEGVLPGTDLQNFDGNVSGAFAGEAFTGGAAVSVLGRTYGLPEDLDDPDAGIEIRMQRQALRARGEWSFTGLLEALELRIHAGRYAHDELEVDADGEELELSFDQRVFSATATGRHAPIGPLSQGALGLSIYARDLLVGGEEALTPDGSALRLAAFVFEEARILPTVTLQVALRTEFEATSVRPNELFPDASDSRRSIAVSGAVGTNIRPARGLEFGIQVAQAFRSPTLEERYSDAAHVGAAAYEIGDPDLDLERALGVDVFGRISHAIADFEVALFAMRIADFVVYQPTGEIHAPSGLPIFVYEADAAMQVGGEIMARIRPVEWLRVEGAGDYVRGTRLDDGSPLPRIPPLRFIFGTLVDRQDWWAGGRLRVVTAQHRTAPNEEATGGYVLAGLEGGFRIGPDRRHAVTLRIDNLLDVAYRDHLSRVEARNAAMPGRNLSVTYRMAW